MNWIARDEALRRLGVKPQSLYAYVSRGLIASRPDQIDSRASLFSAVDIEACLQRRRSGRRRRAIAENAIAWGEPILETKITTVRDGRLIYAGRDAVTLAEEADLETAARTLWGQAADWRPPCAAWPTPPGADAKSRGLAFLAQRSAEDAPSMNRTATALYAEAFQLLCGLGDAFVGAPHEDAFHAKLAACWGLSRHGAEIVRRALVLVADHELNPSTFAARVAASTGASLAAAALAGFAALTGPLHGQASARALQFLRAARDDGPEAAIRAILARGQTVPATGHSLYPDGDPRAAALLARLDSNAPVIRAVRLAEAGSGARANIDMALAAITLELGLPADAPFVLFASGRMVGWLAHAIEQSASGRPIRPRAAYVGP